MACSAIGVSPRTYLSPPFVPIGSGCTSQRSALSSENLSSRDFCFYPRRKGFFSEFGLYSYPSRGFFQGASPSPSSACRRPTYLLAYSRPGGCQRKLYCFRPKASHEDSLPGTTEPISSLRRRGKMGLLRRGLKRTSSNHICSARGGESQSNCKDWFGEAPSWKATPFASRKKLRCWNEEGDAGEPPPDDRAALQALEQAIQFQVKEETRLFFGGPARGDLAEVEAFCRLYRHAEQLHSTVMKALRTHSTTANLDNDKALGPYIGDVLEVEEKVASGLAHLMSILHEGKGEILGLRTTDRRNIVEEVFPDDDLPPFARLRKAVRASCSVLEDALESLLPSESQQGQAARERMLKLKNACLDAGFPRPEGTPSPADIPNLAPVRLRPSKSARTLYKEENVAFWRGGHITEAGLAWLVQKGFKTIVDLREGSAQPIAQSARPEAVVSGKLKVVRMPVERGTVPSKDQVEEFARLVEDPDSRPLYLHTRAGVGRASAMVSRWREVLLRKQLMLVGAVPRGASAAAVAAAAEEEEEEEEEETAVSSDLELLSVDDAVRISQEDALALENAIQGSQNVFFSTATEKASSSNEDLSVATDGSDSNNAPASGDEALAPAGIVQEEEEEQVNESASGSAQEHDTRVPRFDVTKNAFEAQRPIRNVLSRKAMSKFMKRRKVPSIFFTSRRPDKALVSSSSLSSSSSSSTSLVSPPNGNIAGLANRCAPSPSLPTGITPDAGNKGGGGLPINGSYNKSIVTTNGNVRLEAENKNGGEGTERNEEQRLDGEKSSSSLEIPAARKENGSLNGATGAKSPPDDPEEPGSVEGDMCASTTGVVRLQSRRKAEMFLVRTDGYSCTRERVKESTLAFTHPSTQQQMLMWKTPPRTVLLLKKLGKELTEETQEVASFLYHQEGMNVMVEPDVHDTLARLPGFGFIQTFYNQDLSELHERVDFVVCLGGDGVILHASNLFRSAVPPVVSFNLGSLGFLTSHTFSTHKEDLQAVIHGHNDMMTGVYITLRMRLRCELYRNGKAVPGKVFDVLNEVVVDRGSNPYLCKIECYERNRLLTKVQADGVIIATPTGSTAYSIAAGGSMVHPNVPCMLFTPICPHSLSFRPIILPDSALLELKVPRDARSNAWVSFDGKRRQQLSKGDSVRISMSEHPLPTVNKSDQTDDWFQSLVRCLNWNERLEQRPLLP